MSLDARTGTVVVAGIGNSDRGDDGVGPVIARHVAGLNLPGVSVVSHAEPLDLLDDELAADMLVVVDAVRSGRRPGVVVVRHVDNRPLPEWTGTGGTHAVGLAVSVELARVLGRMPRRLVLVGVEAESFAIGAPLSPAVRAAIAVATDAVAAVVGSMVGGGG